ncbi:MAG: hypothetical protein H7202_02495 [Pedobacter sp.]|nr:hypothetical protein [Pedobacter sp.]
MKTSLFIFIAAVFFSSCTQKNEDIVKEPNKEGSIETVVSVTHENGFDILTTTHKVWVKNKLDKTLIKIDTLASLGTTLAEGEDENGNKEQAVVPKDYEFYITVK